MVNTDKKYSVREYKADTVVWFRKTKEAFGGLSNMCSGYPLVVNGHKILSSEALYQACRFPSLSDIQEIIIAEKSPMTAKMKSKPHRNNTRKDWDNTRIAIMRWCLHVKLAQNFIKFGKLLEETYPKQIVEDSNKDKFWGAVREKNDENTLIGINALGRLLMELRQKYMSEDRYDLLVVEPLQIEDFKLFGQNIERIDERINFVDSLIRNWGLNDYISINHLKKDEKLIFQKKELKSDINNVLNSDENNLETQNELKSKVIVVLKQGKAFSSQEIIKRSKINWKTSQMTSFLKKINEIEVVNGKPLKFKLKDQNNTKSLF